MYMASSMDVAWIQTFMLVYDVMKKPIYVNWHDSFFSKNEDRNEFSNTCALHRLFSKKLGTILENKLYMYSYSVTAHLKI